MSAKKEVINTKKVKVFAAKVAKNKQILLGGKKPTTKQGLALINPVLDAIEGKSKQAAAKAAKPANGKAGENFLFRIPSAHVDGLSGEYGKHVHLVVAKDKVEACKLLAEARVKEKFDSLEGDNLVAMVMMQTGAYLKRPIEKVEPCDRKAGVVAINQPIAADAEGMQ
ncbi:MAG TPA: hypothetical protein VNL14_16520 [Candidatus Acidoferrales bacterium]|nr:hypothetical protein [Candidatus Acidoferrales bacterium]